MVSRLESKCETRMLFCLRASLFVGCGGTDREGQGKRRLFTSENIKLDGFRMSGKDEANGSGDMCDG